MRNTAPSYGNDSTAHHLARRFGYPVPAPSAAKPLLLRLRRASVRMFPLNRRDPEMGAWSGDCPSCDSFRALNVEPDGHWWTTCLCFPQGGDEIDIVMFLRDRPNDDVVEFPDHRDHVDHEAPRAHVLDLPEL